MSLKRSIVAALMTALCFVATYAVPIPTPNGGYIHAGDAFVLLSGILVGPLLGFLAAGIGSALADMAAGFSIFIPATFLIKGAMAALVAALPFKNKRTIWLSFVLAEVIMLLGYAWFDYIAISKTLAGAWMTIPMNLIQAAGGVALAYFLYIALDRVGVWKKKVK